MGRQKGLGERGRRKQRIRKNRFGSSENLTSLILCMHNTTILIFSPTSVATVSESMTPLRRVSHWTPRTAFPIFADAAG